jgi:RHS repeat-associated protein
VTKETNVESVDVLFGYTGRPFDEATGLQNNLNRWYDASVGRWISEDPIGFAAGDSNVYRYVGNRPVNSRDANGSSAIPPIVDPIWVVSRGLVVHVDQPGDGGDDDYIEDGNVGHVFVTLFDLEKAEIESVGLYPTGLEDDSDTPWDVEKTFWLSDEEYEKVKTKIKEDKKKPPDWTVYYNCVNWASDVVEVSGNSIPTDPVKVPVLGDILSPGPLGEDLIDDGGNRHR